jgi:hypothetical protein
VALRRPLLLIFCLWLLTQPLVSSAATQDLLRNGGFDQGTGGWRGSGLSSSGCAPAAGSGALRISSSGSNPYATQKVTGPIGSGNYSLTGLVMAMGGPANMMISLIWFDKNDHDFHTDSTGVSAGESYSSFSLNTASPADAASVQVRISISGQQASDVCLDNLNLSGPPPPSPTATITPTASPTPSPSTTPTPQPSPTVKPTSTPRPTATPKPTSTTTPAATQLAPTPAPATALSIVQPENTETPSGVTAIVRPGASVTPESTHPEPTPAQAVLAAVVTSTPAGSAPPLALTQSPSSDDGVPLVWLAGGALFVGALGSSYVYARRRED